MKRHKIFHWTAVIAGVLCCGGVCQQKTAWAEFVAVDWSGDYIPTATPSYLHFNGHTGVPGDADYKDPNTSVLYVGRLVSDSIAYNPDPAYNATALSGQFFGGHVVEWKTSATTNPGFDLLQVENKSTVVTDPVDYMRLKIVPNTDLKRYAAMFYWKKEGFLNGFDSPTSDISFTNGSVFSLTSAPLPPGTIVIPQPSKDAEQVRWVVRNGSQFYISDQTQSIYNKSFFLTSSFVKDLTWRTYNPIGVLSDIFINSGTPASTSDFTDVTALGFYLASNGDKGFEDIDLLIKQFQVTASPRVVPEPGFAMVGLFGVGVFAVRQLKKRKSKSSGISAEDSPVMPEVAPA